MLIELEFRILAKFNRLFVRKKVIGLAQKIGTSCCYARVGITVAVFCKVMIIR